MTIYLYSGTPGSGKSLHATRDIYEYCKYKHLPVIANYDMSEELPNRQYFTYKRNDQLNPTFLIEWASRYWAAMEGVKDFSEDSILFVIDECQLLFNSRDWNAADRMAWLEFFSQHRKFGYKIIFIAQSGEMVDKQFRALIEYECIHRKLGNYGIKGKLLTFLFGGEVFVCVNKFYSMKAHLGASYFRKSKKILALYNSYARFERATTANA